MTRLLSRTFPSVKLRNSNPSPKSPIYLPTQFPSSSQDYENSKTPNPKSWSVYLILSTNHPIKTYVGITTDFKRRGGAKASSAGRPWLCACIINGFTCLSQASSFEAKWKICSRKLPRRKEKEEMDQSDALLQHRRRALDIVQDSLECRHLEIDWKIL